MIARENPFRTGRVERILSFDPTLIGTSWERIQENWEQLNYRACVCGHHGAGKTTFLKAFGKRLAKTAEVHFLFFNRQQNRLQAEDHALLSDVREKLFFIDGDQHLKWRERRALHRSLIPAKGVLVTRHKMRKYPILLKLRSTPQLAAQLLERIDPSYQTNVRETFHKNKGNLRELWLDYYDDCSNQLSSSSVSSLH